MTYVFCDGLKAVLSDFVLLLCLLKLLGNSLTHLFITLTNRSFEFINALVDLLHVLSDENISDFFDLFSGVVLVLKVHGGNRSRILVGKFKKGA